MVGSSTTKLRAPVFNGENYEFWRIRMMTILKLYGMWELVENGFEPPNQKDTKVVLDETKKEMTELASFIETLMKDARVVEIPITSLKGFEQRLDLHIETSTERAFANLNVAAKGPQSGGSSGNQKFQKNWKPRGRGWDHKPNFANRQNNAHINWDHMPNFTLRQNNTQGDCKWCDRFHYGKCWYEGKPKCTGCGKLGHVVKDCHENKGVQKANYARQMGEIGSLFYAYNAVAYVKVNNSWYIDNGSSNHMTGDERHKLEEKSHKCIFVGYDASEKGYRLFDSISRKIILSRDVTFDKNASWN
ncbi:uncharacterized protein [Pyrus communis]|uniref:uncharacterized protein n=1 Tax=Pyrus communis TaxID=23211 RepID=UPI0035BF55F2